jgi:SNF2 family DNA or RNA helicase
MQPTSHQNTKHTTVDFDDKRGRFIIRCPVWDNNRVRALPNRRWSKAQGCWHAPAIRANVEFLQQMYSDSPTTHVTDAAKNKITGYMSERAGRNKTSAFPVFYGFKRQPRPKQREALDKTYGLHATALFMDMRTGKTKVAIDWACAMRMEGKIDKAILVCPLSLRKNWVREFVKDAPIPIDAYLLDTSKPKEFERWLHHKHDFKWLLVGVESLAAGKAIDFAKRFALTSTRVLVAVDESSKIKTHNATRSENAVSLARMCEYRMIMTGTPLTKNPLDLYMQYEFLDPDIIGLGDYYAFRARYAEMGGYENRQVIGYNNLDELVELVSPYTFQVRQHEVFQHDKTRVLRTVQMAAEQKRLYKELKSKSRLGLLGSDLELVVQNVLEKSLRLQEIAGGFVSYQHTEEELAKMRATWGPAKKLPRTYRVPIPGPNPKLNDLLEACDEYEGQTIIWCAFKEEIYAVRDALREKYGPDCVVELHGDIDEAQRDVNVYEMFQKKKARFIVGNTATGGMGLTMDIADSIFFYSNTYNFVDREQGEERGTAEGKNTLIVDFACDGTIDGTIMAANEEKKDLSEYIRGKIDAARAADRADVVEELLDGN